MNATANMMLFSGSAHSELANQIAEHLGKPLGKAHVSRFDDGEIQVELQDNVQGRDVFIIQPTCSPVNDNLIEFIALADALRRGSAKRIIAIMPYFGYARQDKRIYSKPISMMGKVVANMISSVNVNHVVAVDLYSDQIQGFFDIPVDNLYSTPVFLEDIRVRYSDHPLVIVSPDIGGVRRVNAIANQLQSVEVVIIDKEQKKLHPAEDKSIIETVTGKHCIIIDDAVDTANTLCFAAQALKKRGAQSVSAYCTHPVLSGNAIERIQQSVLDEVVVTNTIALSHEAQTCQKLRVLSLHDLLANAIHRIHCGESVSSLFLS